LHSGEPHNMYPTPDIIRQIKSRWMRWAGYVACMGAERRVQNVLVGKPEGNRRLGRPRHRWENEIRMDLGETGWEGRGVKWILLAQDRDRCGAHVNVVMNRRVPTPRC
jgi:hypothetical protein